MLITAHQHLDTHKQNQSGTRSQPKTFSYYKKTKHGWNMIKHTEHFPSNLQAAAHKTYIWFYTGPGGRANKRLAPAAALFSGSETHTCLFSVHILSSVRYQYVQHIQVFPHWKTSSISCSKWMDMDALASGLQLTPWPFQSQYFHYIWKSHPAI